MNAQKGKKKHDVPLSAQHRALIHAHPLPQQERPTWKSSFSRFWPLNFQSPQPRIVPTADQPPEFQPCHLPTLSAPLKRCPREHSRLSDHPTPTNAGPGSTNNAFLRSVLHQTTQEPPFTVGEGCKNRGWIFQSRKSEASQHPARKSCSPPAFPQEQSQPRKRSENARRARRAPRGISQRIEKGRERRREEERKEETRHR